jgi:hypothetical protein
MIEPTAAVEDRLRDASIAWLTTVGPDGEPQPSPVWFLWQDGSIVIYSKRGTPRLRNIEGNPRVAINLDADAEGGSVVVIEGRARLDPAGPRSSEVAAYQAKYRRFIDAYGWTPASFDRDYPARIVIDPTRLRAW